MDSPQSPVEKNIQKGGKTIYKRKILKKYIKKKY